MASQSLTRSSASSAKLTRRNLLRRAMLETLERRELLAADILGYENSGYQTLTSNFSDPLTFVNSGSAAMTLSDITQTLDGMLGDSGGDLRSRSWFPLIQQSYDQWSQSNGLAYSFTTAPAEGELVGEGEAGGPRLLSVAPNSGDIFTFNNVNTLDEAPTELVFRFDGSTGLNPTTVTNRSFKLTRAARDGTFGNGNDQVITPGFLGFGDNNRIVVMRFATTLPDDLYRVEVIGADNALANEQAVRNTANRTLDSRTFDSTPADTTRDSLDFKLELGAQVVSVVPQPVDRLATATVNLAISGGAFNLEVHQSDVSSNVAGNSVSLRLVQSGVTTTTATYDIVTNRITVDLAPAATIANVVSAINNSLAINFTATTVSGGTQTVLPADLVTRTLSLTNWSLDPKLNQIRVYFNNDDLWATSVKTGDVSPNPTVVDPSFYQLILTSDTVQPSDDIRFTPTQISYDPALDLATLTFGSRLDLLAGSGTYRLRIGGNDVVAEAANPKTIVPITPTDPGGTFATATVLPGPTTAGLFDRSTAVTINNQSIITTSSAVLPINYPGGNQDPGHRDIQDETHLLGGADASPQINTRFYNFALNRPYGVGANGQPVFTTLSAGDEGLDRIREIFEFYSMLMGIDFVESDSQGITVVVGDLFPNGGQSSPGGVIGLAGGNLAIMDSAEVWDYSFGGSSGIPGSQNFFETAMHEVGHCLGLGHTYEQPPGTIMGAEGDLNNPNPGLGSEWVFPGDVDIVHGRYMYRPDNKDIDNYSFTIPAGVSGTFTAETFAERLQASSNLDTFLTLLKRTANGYDVVAINNDSFSSDSYLNVKLTEGEYFISVTGKGNESFNPLVGNTGDGAVSQGAYQLKVNFVADSDAKSIIDTSGTALDGDGDGISGGNFNFWFRTAAPVDIAAPGAPKIVYVDKGFAGPQSGPLLGSAAQPLNNLDFTNTLKWPVGFLKSGDVVRVVGSLGADQLLSTATNNPAFEIGRGGVGNAVLSDGLTLDVPQGVTMIVDAGAIFKVRNSRISTGSLDAGNNKSFASLQVLGTPKQTVNFTSYDDQSQGTDTNPLNTVPRAGDWGGLDFHNDVDRQEGRGDYERKGIFLNYSSFADIRYGGGQVTVVSPSPTINPINLSEARPTLLFNTIRFSAGAAISADPNSFEETLFTEPRYQLVQSYAPDFDRVGPDLRGNILTQNSVNGLFIRTTTTAGGSLTTLNAAARLSNQDITYVLSENLIISGTPSGAFLEVTAPDVSLVQLNNASGGTLTPGQPLFYKVTFFDRFGNEGVPSTATPSVTPTSTAITLNNLPAASGDFVGRRLWRSSNGTTFTLVAELDRGTSTYTDLGVNLGANLASPFAASVQRARPDARLQIDPGIIVKSAGSRIEVGISAQLIAEGTPEHKVIFTSRADDRYGAGGTFDTNGDLGASNPSAGDWGGLVARHLSSMSIDSAVISYGGGVTSVNGGFAGFNAVELYQAEGRIANSILENNGSGLGGNLGGTRDGRGPHDASVIFVAGSQPVIINNIIRNNAVANTAAISINANAMTANNIQDQGRQTGLNNRSSAGLGNSGPLVDGNQLATNSINGMRVRGQTLTTETVWDDTDIVHVLQSEVIVPDFHTYGGLRLQSHVDEGLVVKLSNGGGFTALGRPLDITDRIGGSLQIIGAPGFPVVLTSLTDDSVGAGFDPTGNALLDTNNNGPSSGTVGGWRSIKLEPYANDRNVDTTFEYESDQIQDVGTNDFTTSAQGIGNLSPTLRGGDENLRLGFTVHGTLASTQDLDVYSFNGTAGTPVWIDIDHTNGSLDTLVELVDSSGNIIAQSNNSLVESSNPSLLFVDASKISPTNVQPLDQDPFALGNTLVPGTDQDLYSVNPHDAGLRVVLPGTAGGTNTYYVRVRSSNPNPTDLAQIRSGLSEGAYRLQVRMQQSDEVGGSTVRFADIRFATNGIEVNGMPAHSPLLGQISEEGDAGENLTSTNLSSFGNIGNADRGSVSLAGSLNAVGDVDLYAFSVSRGSTQQLPGNGGTHISTILDIDYADGLARPDTTLWVYQRTGGNNLRLVLVGTDSNVLDDRSNDLSKLGAGSSGARDPFVGASELPPGNYVVAVTNNSRMAIAMQQFQSATLSVPSASNIRLEPVNSVDRLFVDRIGSSSPDTAAGGTPVLFTTGGTAGGISTANSVPWTLADLTTYVVRDQGAASRLFFANAMTGAAAAQVSDFNRVNDAKMSPDGRLVGYQIPTGVQSDGNSGNLLLLNSTGAAATLTAGNSGIQTFTTQQTGATAFAVQQRDIGNGPQGDGIQFSAITFFTESNTTNNLLMFGVGSRGNNQTSFNLPALDANNNVVGIAGVSTVTTNIVYKLDPNTGAAINPAGVPDRTANARVQGAGTQKVEFGRFITTGTITGMAEIGGVLFAVSSLGEFFSVFVGNGNFAFGNVLPSGTITNDLGAPLSLTGLTSGPRNLENGRFANMLFGTTSNGTFWAFDTNGVKQPVFPGFATNIRSTTASLGTAVNSIDFSPLDVNLWHVTNTREGDAGHGRTIPFDNSQESNLDGGNSLYFGFESTRIQGSWEGVNAPAAFNRTYDLPGGAAGAIVSNPIDLRTYSSADLPTLYFSYFLATQNSNSNLTDNQLMNDAFRVYAAGEDGTWILLTTNNSAGVNANRLDGIDEFDIVGNQNADPFNNPLFTQETFDNTGTWRQARVSLAALAGQENVRLRFEFSSGGTFNLGNAQLGGIELTAVQGAKLNDGERFTVNPQDGVSLVGSRTFELDLGLVLNLPSGQSITSGVSAININGTVVTFSLTSNVGNNVQYLATDSPVQIATKLRARLPAILGIGSGNITANSLTTNILNIANLPAGGTYTVTSLPTTVIEGRPGVASGNVAVAINQSMTDIQVRDAIRAQLIATYNSTTNIPTANATALDAWPVFGASLRMYKYLVSNNLSGLALTVQRFGDQFGVQNAAIDELDQRAQNNAFEGVYIDDIIVGFAERGEMVLNSGTLDASSGFTLNPNYATTSFGIPQVEEGAYQLTIRTAAEFGQENDPVDGNITLARSYDTNDRLAQQVGISVASTASGRIADRTTFTVSDGVRLATFEFDVTVGTGDTATGVTPGNITVRITADATPTQIATAIRDAINSPTAQSILKVRASLQGEMRTGTGDAAPSGGVIVSLVGSAAANLTGGLTFSSSSQLTAIQSGTDTGFGEDLGDTERQREQGQILLVANTVTNSSGFGIVTTAGNRNQSGIGDTVGDRPYPGSPINLPVQNTSGLAPGVVIMNNILANNASGGIRDSGDAAGGMTVPRLITRIVNNTIFGGTDGILVNNGSSPTILNNVIANTGTGIRSVGSTVVLGANTFQNNTTNTAGTGGNGSFANLLAPSDPLFVSTTNRRFYLAPGSSAIDSSLEALQERAALTQVKDSILLPASPMLAPDTDVTGQKRVDDPTVNTPAGLGGNVFKDRGAVDRSDFDGLTAVILQPQDNDSSLNDQDRNTTYIQVSQGELEFFSILLQDNGTGPDESTVTAATVTLTENGRLLIPGTDYVFGYNANSRTIRLTPIAGIWRKDSVYEISLINRLGHRVSVADGTATADGASYTVTYPGGSTVFEFDKGNGVASGNIAVPIANGMTAYQVAAALSAAISGANLGVSSYLQGGGTLMVVGATSVTGSGVTTVAGITDLAGNPLFANRANSLTQFTIVMPEVQLDFGDLNRVNVATIKAPNSFVAPVVTNGDGARHAILPIDEPFLVLGKFVDTESDGSPTDSATGDDNSASVSLGTLSGVTIGRGAPAVIEVVNTVSLDGQKFVITDSQNHPLAPVTFELDINLTVTPGAIRVPVAGLGTSGVATEIAAAINSQVQAGKLNGIIAVNAGSTVNIIANNLRQIDLSAAPSISRLNVGDTSLNLTAATFADGQRFSISDSLGRVVSFEINDTSLTTQTPVPAGFVAVNVALNVVPVAPAVATAIANAINAQIAALALSIGPATAVGSVVSLSLDDEDGVQFGGVFNAKSDPIPVRVTSTGAGVLDAWVDWNNDGDFADNGENIIASKPVLTGVNVFNVQAPVGSAVGFVASRFRVSVLGNLLPSGVGIGGEVEDHLIEIVGGTPPVAVNDTGITFNEDQVLTVTAPGILGNDTDADNDPLAVPPYVEPIAVYDENPATAAIDPLTNVQNGTLTLRADGSFDYVPNRDFFGTDTFVYRAIDQRLISRLPATVTINVAPRNDSPIAFGDSASLVEDQTFTQTAGFFTANDFAHYLANPNETQVLGLLSASIVTETKSSFGFTAPTVTLTANVGQGLYGINVVVTAADLGAGTLPTISVTPGLLAPTTIQVTLNSHAATPSTIDNFVTAIQGNAAASALVSATVSGAGTTVIGNQPSAVGTITLAPVPLPPVAPLAQFPARPTATSSFGLQPVVKIASKAGQGINGVRVNVSAQDRGAGAAPLVTVSGDSIFVTLNSNATTPTTINQFVTALTANAAANALVTTTLDSGDGTVAIGNLASAASRLVVPPRGGTFAVSGTGAASSLTYTPPAHYNSNISGPVLIAVTIQDDAAAGPTANLTATSTLTINVIAVNDAPEYTMPTTTSTFEDGGVVTVPDFVTGIRPGPVQAIDESGVAADGSTLVGPEGQTVHFAPIPPATGLLVRAINPSQFAVQPTITVNGLGSATLSYQLAVDINQQTPFTPILVEVIAEDTGAVGGPNSDVNRSAPRTFTILPTAINDAPIFTIPATTNSLEDQGVVTIPGFLTQLAPGPLTALDEAGQLLSVTITADPAAFTATGYPTIDLLTGSLRYETGAHLNRYTGQSFIVGVTIIDNGGTLLGGVDRTSKNFSIVVTELNDAPEYNMPSFTSAFQEDPLAPPGAPTVVPNFVTNIKPGPTAAVDEGPLRENQQVSFVVTALNPALFNILPTISATGTLTYRLNPDVNNITPFPTILVEVVAVDTGLNDGGTAVPRNINTATTRTFTILPDPINDAPEFTIPAVINSNEDQGGVTVAGFVTGARPGPITALDELANQTLTITVVALDPTAFRVQPSIALNPATGLGVLTYETNTDVNNFTGHDLRVRVTLRDNGGTANLGDVDTTIKTFSISVAPINDIPTFALPVPPVVSVFEDNEQVINATQTQIANFASSIVAARATATDETTNPATRQTLQFTTVSVSSSNLFTATGQPVITPTGILQFTTNPNQNGQAVVVVQLVDSGPGTSTGNGDINTSIDQTFTIVVRPVNDAPEFTIPTSNTGREDQGLITVANFATGIRRGPLTATDEAGQTLTVQVTALDPSAFAVQPQIGADGTLTYQTNVDVNSTMTNRDLRVEVFITDNGTTGPLPDTNMSVRRTFTIIANPINDAPSFAIANPQVNVIEDVESFTGVAPTVISGFATNIATGPATATDEASQTLSFEVLSVTAPELFSQQPTISAAGNLSFQTASHRNGTALVVVRLVDNGAASPAPNINVSLPQTLTISIAPINDAPQFDLPTNFNTLEDAGLVVQNNFATNVRRGPVGSEDENSQEISFIATALNPSFFAIQPIIGVDGTLTFQLAPNVNSSNADLRVVVRLSDNGASSPAPNNNLSTPRTFTIVAAPVNDSPIADSFTGFTTEDVAVTIQASSVLVGDVPGPTPDENNQTLSITQIERRSAQGGIVTPVFSGSSIVSFTYTPPDNLVGQDTFLYVVTDNGAPNRSGTGTITITLSGVNDPPQFNRGGDQIVPEDNATVTVTNWATGILAGPPGATDEIGTQTVSFNVNTLQTSLFEVQPAVSSNGTLTYKPAKDANGQAVVTVVAVDSGSSTSPNVNSSAPQTFTISITALNDPPVFTAGPAVSVPEDGAAYSQPWATNIRPAAGLLANPQTALDEASQIVDFTVTVDRPLLFSVQPTISSTGVLQFTTNSNAFGQAILTITAVDRGPAGGQNQNSSVPQTLTINITAQNDAPVAVADNFATNENSVLNLAAPGLLANDTDVDLPNDQLSAIVFSGQTALGAQLIVNADGSISYDPTQVTSIQQLTSGQTAQDSFTYTIRDTAGTLSTPVTVLINVTGVNDPPTAVADSFSVGVGQSRLLDVLANDFDVDSPINPSTINVTALPAFGTVSVNQTGVIRYTPGGGFRGVDTFAYTVRDTEGNVSNEAIVTVTVNSAPVAQNDTAFTFKNTPVNINVLANDSDTDGTLNVGGVQVVIAPGSGTAVPLPNGQIRFTPGTDFSGLTSFSYVVVDDVGTASNVATVNVRIQFSRYQNPQAALDVNADGIISPIDALLVINYINDGLPTFLPPTNFQPAPFIDVNGDESVTPLDVLLVINHLNEQSNTPGGEGEASFAAPLYVNMVTAEQMVETVGQQVIEQLQGSVAGITFDDGEDASLQVCYAVESVVSLLADTGDTEKKKSNQANLKDGFFFRLWLLNLRLD